jgi:hypothetical protein
MMYILIMLLLIVHTGALRMKTANISVMAFDKLNYQTADAAFIKIFSYKCNNEDSLVLLFNHPSLTRDDIVNINMTQTYQGQNITNYDSNEQKYSNSKNISCHKKQGDHIYVSIYRFKMKLSTDLNILIPNSDIPLELSNLIYNCKALDKFCSIYPKNYMIWEYNPNKPEYSITLFETEANVTELGTKSNFIFKHNDITISLLIDSEDINSTDYIMTNLPWYIVKIINISKTELVFKNNYMNKLKQLIKNLEKDLNNINIQISSKRKHMMSIVHNITISKEIYSKLMNTVCKDTTDRLLLIFTIISFILEVILFIYYFSMIKNKITNVLKKCIKQDCEVIPLNNHNRRLPNVPYN